MKWIFECSFANADPQLVRSHHNARRAVRLLLDRAIARALVVREIAEHLRTSGMDLERIATKELNSSELGLTGSDGALRRQDLSGELDFLVESRSLSTDERSIFASIYKTYLHTNELLDNPPERFKQFRLELDDQSEKLVTEISQLNTLLDIGRADLLGER